MSGNRRIRVMSGRSDSTLVKKVYARIKEDIISQRLLPGEPLVEERLVEILQVSRTPLRAALNTLNHQGLVRIIPKKGAFVRVLTPKDIREIYEVREALEGFAISEVAGRLESKELRFLVGQVRSLKRRQKDLGYKDLRDAWENLRSIVTESLNNDRIRGILDTMRDQIEAARHFSSAPTGRIDELLADFVETVDSLKNRDGAKAAKALQNHLRKSKRILLGLFGSIDEFKTGPAKINLKN
jgi:DNA-binding GntR family transcriptional regulator